MADKVFPKGIMAFAPNQKAPDFVKGTVVISLNDLVQFCKDHPELLTEYKGTKQLRLQLNDGNKGLYFQVDTYRGGNNSNQKDDLPF